MTDAAATPLSPLRKRALYAGLVVWITTVLLGFGGLAAYASEPGRGAVAPTTWPDSTALVRVPGRATLLVVLHPRCSCSVATLVELRRLLHDARTRPDVFVLFVRPSGAPASFHDTAIWHEANALAGVHVVVDDDGGEARRFDAATSGQTLLYDADGRLAFRGGITPARGHEGDSRGRSELLALLAGSSLVAEPTSVFGCPVGDDPSRGATR